MDKIKKVKSGGFKSFKNKRHFTNMNINEMKTCGHSLCTRPLQKWSDKLIQNQIYHKLGGLILSFFSFFFIFSCNCVPVVGNESFTVCDNISASQIIGTIPASVPDGQDVTYRLTKNADYLFEIDGDGKISLAYSRKLNFTNTNRYVITVEVSNTVSSDISTADVTIDVITTPLFVGLYTFTYRSNASFAISNRGQQLDSFFTHSGNLPSGLELVMSSGQLLIQGTPTTVTVGGPVSNVITASNKCGANNTDVMVAVNPSIFVSGDQSPGVTHASHANIFKPNAIPFANGGTGAYNDPIVVALADGANNISFVLDFNNVQVPVDNFDALTSLSQKSFHISLLNIPDGRRSFSFRMEQISIPQGRFLGGTMTDWYDPRVSLVSFSGPGFAVERWNIHNFPGPDTIQFIEVENFGGRSGDVYSNLSSTIRFTVNIGG